MWTRDEVLYFYKADDDIHLTNCNATHTPNVHTQSK